MPLDFGDRADISEDELEEIKKKFSQQLAEHLKDQVKYCEYPECLVQYVEHYHCDRFTLTFRKPEEANENI